MLTILRQIIQEVSSAEDFQEALDISVKSIAHALSTEACSIFLFDRKKSEYILAATHGLNPEAVGKVRVPINQGLIGLVGEREEPINIDDATQHPRFLRVPAVKEEAFRAFLGTPLIYHRQVLGVLMVQQQEPRRYDESEEAFLVTLGTQLAAIIAHAEAIRGTGGASLLSTSKEKSHDFIYSGMPGSPGIGIGYGVIVHIPSDLDTVPDREPDDIEYEMESLEHALAAVRNDLKLLSERLDANLPLEERALFDVYQGILDSTNLGKEIAVDIQAGNWAPGALRAVIQVHVSRLEELDNEYMRERAEDIKDLGRRVLAYLQQSELIKPDYQEKTILIGENLSPTDLAEVPEGLLAGVVSMKGSSHSHVAILARAMKVPTIMGVSDAPIYELQNKEIIIDGYEGKIHVSPSPALYTEFLALIQQEQKLDAALEEICNLPANTKDGHRISLLVNTGLGADISIALAANAEGVGLYRTEILFMRGRFPSGEEQRIIYRQLLASFAPRPVILRTLDIGGDKPLPYFPIKEDNPFLGWRGIRVTLDHPEIFLAQTRAMLRANVGLNNMRIMLPMITDVTEIDEALRLLTKAYREVCDEGYHIDMPQIGVMVEVPSAVYQARVFAKRVDFLSVGSNDLTQYILAVDRNNSRVANLYDSLHPAVLRALIQVVENGHQEGKHVSICGEMAGDPLAVILLLAIGFDSLSMNAAMLNRVRWIIRQVTKKKAARLLHEVLAMESAAMIRKHMEIALEQMGLGDLIRAGR